MKDLDFLKHADHSRKAAMYAAEHDGKVRHFAYHEELGECRETFARLLQDVQQGEIGVILAPDATCLSIETSPCWMEAFIQAVKQHKVLIGDHSHDLVYDLRDEDDEARFRDVSTRGIRASEERTRSLIDAIAQSPFAAASLESDRIRSSHPHEARHPTISSIVFLVGHEGKLWRVWAGTMERLLDILAPYRITEGGGWCPVPPERKDWLIRTQHQEDAMAAQTAAAMKPHRASLTKGAQVSVILPGSGRVRGKQRRRRGGRNG